jgi:hypothetical protein
LTSATIVDEQPDALSDHTVFEVLLMAHQFGRARLRALNARALEDGLNLAVTLKLADEHARERSRATRCRTQVRGHAAPGRS